MPESAVAPSDVCGTRDKIRLDSSKARASSVRRAGRVAEPSWPSPLPLLRPPSLPPCPLHGTMICGMKCLALIWLVLRFNHYYPCPHNVRHRFFWMVILQVVHAQVSRNGTDLVCTPFGTCEPCPDDAVSTDTNHQSASLTPPGSASRTVLPTLREPTSHALCSNFSHFRSWRKASPR